MIYSMKFKKNIVNILQSQDILSEFNQKIVEDDFVNDVYESIKTPMFYISDKINTMMDTSNKSIQNKKDPT